MDPINCPSIKNNFRIITLLLLVVAGSCLPGRLSAQNVVNGKIFESETQQPLEGVSIRNKRSGSGELSDRSGFYSVNAREGDSIEVYLLGYKRFKFSAAGLHPDETKNIYLTIEKFNLPGVEVLARKNVTKDSLRNRQDNAALFNYHRPSVAKAILGGVFHPISGLQNLTEMAKNRRMKHFQEHLVNEERDQYIESRFSRQDVEDITGLKGKELEDFMTLYKPTYEFTQQAATYDMLLYIKEKYAEYLKLKKDNPDAAVPGVKPALPASEGSASVPAASGPASTPPAGAATTPGTKGPVSPPADSTHRKKM